MTNPLAAGQRAREPGAAARSDAGIDAGGGASYRGSKGAREVARATANIEQRFSWTGLQFSEE
jgi:hypothetical protein